MSSLKPSLKLPAGAETRLLRDPARLNIQNILCPVDFSAFSQRALKYAASMARHFGARLFVQHTIFTPPEAYLADIDEAATRESLQAELRRAGVEGRSPTGPGGSDLPEIRLLVTGGSVVKHILRALRKIKSTWWSGSHGRRGFSRVFLGSVAETIVHQASCPVLVISHPEKGFFSESDSPRADSHRHDHRGHRFLSQLGPGAGARAEVGFRVAGQADPVSRGREPAAGNGGPRGSFPGIQPLL